MTACGLLSLFLSYVRWRTDKPGPQTNNTAELVDIARQMTRFAKGKWNGGGIAKSMTQ